MKFASLLVGAALAFTRSVIAESEEFTMLSIHSASRVNLNYIVERNGTFYVKEHVNGTYLPPSVIDDSGKLRVGDGYMVLKDDGTFKLGAEEEATVSFGVRGGHVTLNCVDGFVALPTKGKFADDDYDEMFLLSIYRGEGSIGIALRASTDTGYTIPNFNVEDCPVTTTLYYDSFKTSDITTGI